MHAVTGNVAAISRYGETPLCYTLSGEHVMIFFDDDYRWRWCSQSHTDLSTESHGTVLEAQAAHYRYRHGISGNAWD